jgi:heme-binding NEAT domain protein
MGLLTGPVVSAAAGDNWGQVKIVQTNRTNNSTLAQDPELFFTINTTGPILWRCDFSCAIANTTMGFQFTVSFGGNYNNGSFLYDYINTGTSYTTNNGTMGAGSTINSTTNITGIHAFGGMVATTTGVLGLRWGQTTANASSAIVYPGSTLVAWKSL